MTPSVLSHWATAVLVPAPTVLAWYPPALSTRKLVPDATVMAPACGIAPVRSTAPAVIARVPLNVGLFAARVRVPAPDFVRVGLAVPTSWPTVESGPDRV